MVDVYKLKYKVAVVDDKGGRNNITDYIEKHLNMNYDRPVTITLKIKENGYTALHDCFGDKFLYKKSIDAEHDEIEVVCSEHAMIDWAMQFCDRVEVIRPQSIRKKIKEKAEVLYRKYS